MQFFGVVDELVVVVDVVVDVVQALHVAGHVDLYTSAKAPSHIANVTPTQRCFGSGTPLQSESVYVWVVELVLLELVAALVLDDDVVVTVTVVTVELVVVVDEVVVVVVVVVPVVTVREVVVALVLRSDSGCLLRLLLQKTHPAQLLRFGQR